MRRARRKSRGFAESLGGLDQSVQRRVRPIGEARVLRAGYDLRSRLKDAGDAEKAVRSAARFVADLFHADEHCIAIMAPGESEANLLATSSATFEWDRRLLAGFIRSRRPDVPSDLGLARLKRRGRAWGALGLHWRRAIADWQVLDGLRRITDDLNDIVAEIDRERVSEVRHRLDRKIMRQLRSEDLFYQILDGLKSLTRYDHSATLLIEQNNPSEFLVAAEKLAWRRGKSKRVGHRITLDTEAFDDLAHRGVTGCQRTGDAWRSEDPVLSCEWLESLDQASPVSGSGDWPSAEDALVTCAVTADDMRALLVLRAVAAGTFGEYERRLLASFVPHMTVALQNTREREVLEARILETERKHAMADLARSVAHDVNNALGAVVPLVEQLRYELDQDRLDPVSLRDDLVHIERSVMVCERIFGGMLRFARGGSGAGSSGSVQAAVETALSLHGDGLARKDVRVTVEIPADTPMLRIGQTHLDQVILNLVGNARDALGRRGSLAVTVAPEEERVRIFIRDDGCGIPTEAQTLVLEPFYTTKTTGNGLGLAICRSLVWQSGGSLRLESAEGRGTTVEIDLPVMSTGTAS